MKIIPPYTLLTYIYHYNPEISLFSLLFNPEYAVFSVLTEKENILYLEVIGN